MLHGGGLCRPSRSSHPGGRRNSTASLVLSICDRAIICGNVQGVAIKEEAESRLVTENTGVQWYL